MPKCTGVDGADFFSLEGEILRLRLSKRRKTPDTLVTWEVSEDYNDAVSACRQGLQLRVGVFS